MVSFIKEVCYWLLDLITLKKGIRVHINKYPIVLPARYHRYFPKEYETENFNFFREHCKNGMNCIDVGAHFGLFSIYMQKMSKGFIYSFEPTPSTASILKKTIYLNKVNNNIEVIPAAVADQNGVATFFIETTPGSVSNSLVDYGDRHLRTSGYDVQVIKLDDFVGKRNLKIDFIKIDAEGVELSVLKGAQQILLNQRPKIILALHPLAINKRNETTKMIWDFLKECNYNIFSEGKLISEYDFSTNKDLFDVQLVPSESR